MLHFDKGCMYLNSTSETRSRSKQGQTFAWKKKKSLAVSRLFKWHFGYISIYIL